MGTPLATGNGRGQPVLYAFTSFAPSRDGSPADSPAPQHVLGEFPTYAGAEEVVDRLSDNGSPSSTCASSESACAPWSTSRVG